MNLLPNVFECIDSFRNFFQASIYFTCVRGMNKQIESERKKWLEIANWNCSICSRIYYIWLSTLFLNSSFNLGLFFYRVSLCDLVLIYFQCVCFFQLNALHVVRYTDRNTYNSVTLDLRWKWNWTNSNWHSICVVLLKCRKKGKDDGEQETEKVNTPTNTLTTMKRITVNFEQISILLWTE